MSTRINFLARFFPGYRCYAAALARHCEALTLDFESRLAARQAVIHSQTRVLQEANERIARQGRIWAAEMRRATELQAERDQLRAEHAQVEAVLAQALAETASVALMVENLTDIADGLRNELKTAKARKGKR